MLLKQNKKADTLTDTDCSELAVIVHNVARKKGGLPAPLETLLADEAKPLIPIVVEMLKRLMKSPP